jgi:hypothetical protein
MHENKTVENIAGNYGILNIFTLFTYAEGAC